MRRTSVLLLLVVLVSACRSNAPAPTPPLPNGLLLALAQFEPGPDGKASSKPGPARVEILLREGDGWTMQGFEDPESNVFHKAMVYRPAGSAPGILTLGGNAAAIKLWRKTAQGFDTQTVWSTAFGGAQNRMRDAEVGDLLGQGAADLAVATHDQGVVAVVHPTASGFEATELDRRPNTFVHEVELGDLDGDGTVEVYATPSEPNKFDKAQAGHVVRYVPARHQGPTTVVELTGRHAKEILVGDVDGDGRDELYIAVEAAMEGKGTSARMTKPVEILRHDAGGTASIATIDDRFCRFLTAGDVDGDHRKEIVAASFSTGLWLLRPPSGGQTAWSVESIDKDSGGFEHAALLADLDADGVDELYVADDRHGEVHRYTWMAGRMTRETIFRRAAADRFITWNMMPVPTDLVR